MEKRGFTTHTAASVAGGLSAIEQDIPNFAIIDLQLLDGSGLDVVKSLEDLASEARTIILTGYGDIPTAIAAARIDAVDYLATPATADEIVDVLLAPKDEAPPAPINPVSPEEARAKHIEHVFYEASDNVSRAARLLSMHRRTLQRILKRYGVVTNATRGHQSDRSAGSPNFTFQRERIRGSNTLLRLFLSTLLCENQALCIAGRGRATKVCRCVCSQG